MKKKKVKLTARTPKALADVFEPEIKKARGGRLTVRCESKDESVLLAHELKERGWRATPSMGLVWPKDTPGAEMEGAFLVVVSGPSKSKPKK